MSSSSAERFSIFASSVGGLFIQASFRGPSILYINPENGASSVVPALDKSCVLAEKAHAVVGLTPDKSSLILVSKSSPVCSSPSIRKVDAFRVLELTAPLPENKLKKELLIASLKTPCFYYSPEVDLSRPRLPALKEKPLRRYVWNASHLEALSEGEDFGTPLIHGAVFTFKTPINKVNLQWILVSRRSNLRVGTRFFARGIDEEGNVANHVETEQILRLEGRFTSSFLQTRGSIPIFWHQTPDIRYMPQPWPDTSGEIQPTRAHFMEQMALYGGSLTCVNLVNQTKGEGRMERAFAKAVRDVGLPNVHYAPFDFHAECKKAKGGWAQLYKLIRLLQKDFEDYGYYYKDGLEEQEQKGVFRTNCMDCLDRTNVVQSLLATEHVNSVLKRAGVLKSKEDSVLNYPAFQGLYKNAWADHANLISIQYSGTGALKTDFTRTGVRTHWGMLQDGWNSGRRYVLNNFHDGDRTDALNYFTGALPMGSILAKNIRERENSSNSLLGVFPSLLKGFVVLFVILLVLLSPDDSRPLMFLLTLILTLLLWFFKLNGPSFVNYPTDYVVPKNKVAL